MQKILITLSILTLLLTGCAYKIEIQQGNYITQAQFEQLHVGMSQRQVRVLLGNPMLQDPFHPERWDYFYSLSKDFKVLERRLVTLYFEGETLKNIEREGELPIEKIRPPQPE